MTLRHKYGKSPMDSERWVKNFDYTIVNREPLYIGKQGGNWIGEQRQWK